MAAGPTPTKNPEELVSVDQNGRSLDPEYPVDQHPKNANHPTEKTAVRVDPKMEDEAE